MMLWIALLLFSPVLAGVGAFAVYLVFSLFGAAFVLGTDLASEVVDWIERRTHA